MDPSGVALVTGASRGIGRAVAIELAAVGFDVVAAMRDVRAGGGLAAEAGAAGSRITVARLDVTEPDSIAIPTGLRVLVNNAGVESEHLPVEHTPLSQWREMFETNVFGLVDVTRAAIPALRASGGGVICNITSSSLLVGVPFYAPYRASKAAVAALGESLRAEVAAFGIRVLEVLPGPVATDMFAGSGELPAAAAHRGYEQLADQMLVGRRSVEHLAVSPADAAREICAAIVDDAAPPRIGCDPLSRGMLGG